MVGVKKQGRKFFPHPLTREELALSKELTEELEAAWRPTQAVFKAYRVFCKKNLLDPREEASTVPWCVQMRQVLGPRTIKLYLGKLLKAWRAREWPRSHQLAGLLRLQRLRCCKAPRRHAVDLDHAECVKLCDAMYKANAWIGCIAFLMILLGLRFKDLQAVEWKQLWLPKIGELRPVAVDVRLSKTVRSDWQRRELVVPVNLQGDIDFRDRYIARIADLRKRMSCTTVAPTDVDVNDFNRSIKAAAVEVEAAARQRTRLPTSYTFRRRAMARFIEGSRAADGVVDWARASTFSLHLNDNTLQAFYYTGWGQEE